MSILTVDDYVNQEFSSVGSVKSTTLPIEFVDIMLSSHDLLTVDNFLRLNTESLGTVVFINPEPSSYRDIALTARTLTNISVQQNISHFNLGGDTVAQYPVLTATRKLLDVDEFVTHLSTEYGIETTISDYKRLRLSDKDQVNVDNLPLYASYTTMTNIDGKALISTTDLLSSAFEPQDEYELDYRKLVIDGRTNVDLSDTRSLLDTFGMGASVNDDFLIIPPPKVAGKLYKLFGKTTELGNITSIPTKVMLVDRTGGALTTVSVAVSPDGSFAKFYKDLPENSSFMIIGLWDVDKDPYYEPVIVDRVIPTLIS